MNNLNKQTDSVETVSIESIGQKSKSLLIDINQLKISEIPKYTHYDKHANEMLKASIKKYGVTVPIIADKDLNILAGNRRVAIAKELNIKNIPVVLVDEALNEQEKKNLELELQFSTRKISYLESCEAIYQYHQNNEKKTEFKKHMAEILGTTTRTIESHIANAKSFRLLPKSIQDLVHTILLNENLERAIFDKFTSILKNDNLKLLEHELKHYDTQEIDGAKIKSILAKVERESNELVRNEQIDKELEEIQKQVNILIEDIEELKFIPPKPLVEELSNIDIKKVFEYEIKKYFRKEIDTKNEKNILSIKEAYSIDFTQEIELIISFLCEVK